MNRHGRTAFLVAITVAAALGFRSTAFAASVVTTSTIDGGGLRTSSANYTMDGSVGGIGGISSASADTAKNGYIGQLTEVVSVTATGTPSSVNEGSTSQLSGTATMDDQMVTMLAGSDIAWGVVTYPFQSVGSNGVLTAVASVYAAPTGTVTGYYLGATGSTSVEVLGPYANSGIADSWLVQYFGTPPNPNAAPTADADGTGQNNLFKYVAGLDPTNPASVFTLRIAAVPGQPSQKNLMYQPIASGRTYVMQSVTDLVAGVWSVQATSAPLTNGTQVTVSDPYANTPSKFYRVDIYNILTNLNIIIEDSVGDGILDSWRAEYFGGSGTTTNSQSCATCDADGTGQDNLFKYAAGLNPTNPAAYLHVISIAKTNTTDINVIYLGANGDSTWSPGIASRTNVLEFTTGTANGSYTSTNFTSTGQTNILSGGNGLGVVTNMVEAGGATNHPSRFYRVRVILP